jgi:hypothetical protein
VAHHGIVNGIRRISNSEVQTFKGCRRRWYLEWYRGLRLAVDPPIQARHTGNRVHHALKLWYVPEGEVQEDPRETLETFIREDREVLTASLLARTDNPATDPDMKKLIQMNDVERIMIDGYMEWLEETGADENLEVIAPETYLEARLPDLGDDSIMIVGVLDVRTRRRSDQVRTFIDHKTKAVVPSHGELQRDEQMQHYELLEELTPDEERCDGALYNVLRRTKRTASAKPPFYYRELITHNDTRRSVFRRRLTGTIRDMMWVERRLDEGASHLDVAYPSPDQSCGWKCAFASICTMFDDGSHVEPLLNDLYVSDNPLRYYGDAARGELSDALNDTTGG